MLIAIYNPAKRENIDAEENGRENIPPILLDQKKMAARGLWMFSKSE